MDEKTGNKGEQKHNHDTNNLANLQLALFETKDVINTVALTIFQSCLSEGIGYYQP